MKKTVRLLALLMALVMCICMFAGCGNKKGNVAGKGNTAKDIKISYWNAGYGSKWLENTIKRFEKAYPEYSVSLNMSASQAGVASSVGMEDIDDTDLYLIPGSVAMLQYLEPLNDTLELKAKGEDVTLAEKLRPEVKKSKTLEDGNIYQLTAISGGAYSMVYNKAKFKKYNLSVPRTTNEMAIVADTLMSNKEKAYVSFADGYWNWACYVWYHQYEGADYYYDNFFGCKDAETGESPSKNVFLKKDGRYEIVKAMESILKPDYCVDGSNSQTHTIMQTYFVQGQGAMFYNGGWLENEAASAGNMEDFGVFRLPILSSITKKLTTVKSEMELRNLITAVDSVIDGKEEESKYKSGDDYTVNGKTVAAADWKHIYDARRTTFGSNTTDAGWMIPKYSTAKDAAKEFIAFFYSDANAKAIVEENQYFLPSIDMGRIDADFSDWSDLAKEFYDIDKTYAYTASDKEVSYHEIFTDGGATIFSGVNFIRSYLARNESDRMTADEVWKKITDTVEAKYLPAWLANIT